MNDQEREVIDKLADAWNAFIKMKTVHPDECNEFRTLIHHAQAMIMARPEQRKFNEQKPLK